MASIYLEQFRGMRGLTLAKIELKCPVACADELRFERILPHLPSKRRVHVIATQGLGCNAGGAIRADIRQWFPLQVRALGEFAPEPTTRTFFGWY